MLIKKIPSNLICKGAFQEVDM